MEKDRLIKIGLFPCIGTLNGHNNKDHIYAVTEIFESGKHVEYAAFATVEDAKSKYSGLEIELIGKNHRICPDCMHINHFPNLTKEEIIKRFYPNLNQTY